MAKPHHLESSPSMTAFPATEVITRQTINGVVGQAAHMLAAPAQNQVNIEPWHTTFRGSAVTFDLHYPTGTDPRQNHLALIKGGILTDNDHYSQAANELASLGWTVANVDPLGKMPLQRALAPVHLRDPLRRQSQTIWAAMRHLRETGYTQQFNLIGHSKGAPEALGAAIHHPQEVDTVLLVEPAAMGHSSSEVASDFMMGLLVDLAPAAFRAWRQGQGTEHIKGALQRVSRHGWQVGHDVLGLIGRDDRQSGNSYIANGGKIIVRFGEHDRIFHPKKYLDRARTMTDTIGVLPGLGHGAFQFQPHAVAVAIDETLRESIHAAAQPALNTAEYRSQSTIAV